MKHLGDITKISGYTVPAVDCIIGGSPCQDLSVAGKRAGLDGERSGLYMEQLRIVKELRDNDRRNGRSGVDIRPRYMVWENVPGAFSSNKAEDFRIVLEEIAKVCDESAVIPMPRGGKWTTCGCIVGDGWSVAWRVFDAQFWGVPQRRRRIALVADFGGQSAPEILFVRKSVSGHLVESETQREGIAADAERSIGADDREGAKPISYGTDGYNANLTGDKAATLGVNCGIATGRNGVLCVHLTQDPITSERCAPCIGSGNPVRGQATVGVCYGISSYDSNAMKSNNPNSGIYVADTARTLDLNGGNPACHQGGIAIVENYPYQEKCGALCARDYKGVGSQYVDEDKLVVGVDCRNATEGSVNGALMAGASRSLNCNNVIRTRYTVRRLTPLECERLQGYPDNWTQIGEVVGYERQVDEHTGEEFVQAIYEYIDDHGKKRKTSDAARYKALGNSIALPPWKWVLKRLCACYERDATMASLFDGIGGFPYLWEQLNGKGSCLWASEIEEFPMAVTKIRIGE